MEIEEKQNMQQSYSLFGMFICTAPGCWLDLFFRFLAKVDTGK